MNEPLLQLRAIKKYFPVHRGLLRRVEGYIKAVDGVDLIVGKQEIHALVGESGSGKSTLGRCAIRLTDPTAGEIYFHGHRVDQLTPKEFIHNRRSLQMIFQDPYTSLNPRHTIEKTIGDGLIYHKLGASPNERREIIVSVLESVGLSPDAMMRYPHQFSGGQQQRICIARALALNPELIVCDEAVSALDLSVQAKILNLLCSLQEDRNLSYLFIAHDLSVVRHIADWITVMYLGKVMETGPCKEVFDHPKHPYTQALLESIPYPDPDVKRKKQLILKGEIPSPLNPPSGCPFRTRCPFAQPICAEPPPIKKGRGEGHTYACILD